jgi:hypothetical protein
MMAYSFDGINDFIGVSADSLLAGIETTYPMSVACWFYANVDSTAQGLVTISSTVNARNIHLEYATDNAIYARTRGGSDSPAITSTTASPNTWNHALGVWFGTTTGTTTSRSVYLNGGGKGTNNTSVGTMGLQNAFINIGSRFTPVNNRNRYLNGKIAELAFWRTALTDDDALQLATGTSPLKIRPQSLILYMPIIRNLIIPFNEKARFAAGANYSSITVSGSTPANDHPRRYG